MKTILITLIILAVGLLDVYCYTKAPYPQRTGIGKIPYVGGPLALWKYGRKK